MSNIKHVGVRILRTMTKDNKQMDILQTKVKDAAALCKRCHSEPRKVGSSSCQSCSAKYKSQQLDAAKLKKRIQEARVAPDIKKQTV